jgi:putative membrane protein
MSTLTPEDAPAGGPLIQNSASDELSSNRTSLAFERTRMATDRTLMATVRTSMSLISFGFTINEAFLQWRQEQNPSQHGGAAAYFGLALVVLGIVTLALGVTGHRKFMRSLSKRRARLFELGLVRHTDQYEPTPTFISALLLLVLGLVAAASIIIRSNF